VGADRALIAVALQSLLMTGVRNYSDNAAVAGQTHRFLATAASLDYVLMLASGSAGARISADDTRRAIRAGFARAVDDGLVLLRAIVGIGTAGARRFVRAELATLRSAIESEALADDNRSFALISLANDASV